MEDIKRRTLLEDKREFGSREDVFMYVYLDFESIHLCRKLGIWAIYPIVIIIVIIATPIIKHPHARLFMNKTSFNPRYSPARCGSGPSNLLMRSLGLERLNNLPKVIANNLEGWDLNLGLPISIASFTTSRREGALCNQDWEKNLS